MSDLAVEIQGLGKMYRLYHSTSDRVRNALGLDWLAPWKKNAYKEFWALRDVNLKINKGERLGIIGRNGAGKSSLLKIITGNLTPTEGTVKVSGRVQALMELGTGFHPEFTGRDNIRSSLAYQGLGSKQIKILEEEIIDFSELEDFIDQPVKTYSAGMYARLAFSTATCIVPELLIIDEILGAGDTYFAGKSVERMRKLTEDFGATVLFVSHDLASVQALCDRVIWVDRGKIVADGEPLPVLKKYSATVRRDEEIRLRARDLKVSRKRAACLVDEDEIYTGFLFRLITIDGSPPSSTHKIRCIEMKSALESIGFIDVGAPMDNDPEKLNYIMDDSGLMDWGGVEKDEKGYFRRYADFKGRFRHAPFHFVIPKSYLSNQLFLEVEADVQNNEVAVEVFVPERNEYVRLGTMNPGSSKWRTVIDSMSLIPKEYQNADIPETQFEKSTNSENEYGSLQAFISSVKLMGIEDSDTKILYNNEPFQVRLYYSARIPVDNPVFVFCIYLPSGLCASQWIFSAKDLGFDTLHGNGYVTFKSPCLLLGKGSYVASAAVFKHLPVNGMEPEAYHVIDRSIHFQVRNRNELDAIDYGICRHPIEVEINVE